MRVLAVDDSQLFRTRLSELLTGMGHECVTASDGLEARDLLQQQTFDVVISDWVMPGMDGLELCRFARTQDRTPYTYVMLLTSMDRRADRLTGLKAGADDYLTKPIDPEELELRLQAAERVLAVHHRLAQQNEELQRLNETISHTARLDALTGLGNRLRLREDAQAILARSERYGLQYCAALLDVDFFKSYNDSQGHLRGDRVLAGIAQLVKRSCRESDTAYRYGGEEFLLLLPEQTIDNARVAVERLREAVEARAIPHPDRPDGHPVVTVSAGMAALPKSGCTLERWLAVADAELYRAKAAGRNCVLP